MKSTFSPLEESKENHELHAINSRSKLKLHCKYVVYLWTS